MTKEQVLEAVQKRGYKFSTNNPMNSLGVVLYGRNPRFNRADGKFSTRGSATQISPAVKRSGKRKISAAGRKAIAEAARKRWAAAKAAGRSTL
jgi:hypothetical protein